MNKVKFLKPLLILLIALAGCVNHSTEKKEIYVSAASSLKGPVIEWKRQFEKENPDIEVKTNFGASGVLFDQIKKGAPADLLFSAQSLEYYQEDEHHLTIIQKGIIASNELVFVSGDFEKTPVHSIEDVPSHAKLGLGNPKFVPAGYYAEKALNKVKNFSGETVYSQNAVHLKGLVETGAVDYAIMYLTDALNSTKITVLKTIPQSSYPVIEYPVYEIGNEKKLAKQFLSYVTSREGQRILKKYHFRESVKN
jgi:molybdate transport system substrate-binding protein